MDLHLRLAVLVARARREGWYDEDDRWAEIDSILVSLGQDIGSYHSSKIN
jgi:hypothetical protein